MTAIKDDKRAPPDLEKVIDSDRYKVVRFLGRGCWGSVYEAEDTKLGKTVAIKVMDPTETAKRQMQERKLDELAAMKNEALELQACANIVPRVFDEDKNGVPFIVMPKYDRFFSDVIANPPQKGARSWSAFGEEEQLKTGFFISDIIRFSEDIIKGIAEIHSNYNIAHCDIKPDNLAVDKDGRILISDMGTSTFASIETSSPRDNMGYAYTRSPRLFVEGAHPKKSSDVFALGSLMYKLFTGEYIFEKELNTEKDVKGFMSSFVHKMNLRTGSIDTQFNLKYDNRIADKLENKEIPIEFREFIEKCLHEDYQNGKALKSGFENVVKTYFENRIKKSKFDEFKSKVKTNFLGALGCGTILAGLALGGAWIAYFGPRPDYSKRTDFESQIEMRDIEKSETNFEIERKYEKLYEPNSKPMEELPNYLFKSQNKTLTHRLVLEWARTAEEMPADNNGRRDFAFPPDLFDRWFTCPKKSVENSLRTNYTMLLDVVPCYFSLNQIKPNTVDLEDALTATLVGTQKLREAQKCANNCEFNVYISAKDANGNFVIPEKQQQFLKQLLYNISQALPERVHSK